MGIMFMSNNNCFIRCINKNLNMKFSAHNSPLKSPSSGMLKVDRLVKKIIYAFLGVIIPKGPTRIIKIR